MKSFALYFGVLLSLFGSRSFALEPNARNAIDLAEVPSKVEFLAVGFPSAIQIRGTVANEKPLTGKMILDDQGLQGEVTIDLEQFDTGIGMRNRHMREKYLEVDKFPKASFRFTKLLLPGMIRQTDIEHRDVPFEGVLSLHGKTRDVAGLGQFKRVGQRFDLKFAFAIKTSDFGVKTPSFLKVTVADEVKLTVEMKATL